MTLYNVCICISMSVCCCTHKYCRCVVFTFINSFSIQIWKFPKFLFFVCSFPMKVLAIVLYIWPFMPCFISFLCVYYRCLWDCIALIACSRSHCYFLFFSILCCFFTVVTRNNCDFFSVFLWRLHHIAKVVSLLSSRLSNASSHIYSLLALSCFQLRLTVNIDFCLDRWLYNWSLRFIHSRDNRDVCTRI